MIVEYDELRGLAGKVAMVDGGFDPLHEGHVEYFRAAQTLGLPLFCNVACDEYVRRKHPPLLPEGQRLRILDSIRFIAYTHLNRTGTEDALRRLRPKYYVKGKDWEDRLPPEQVVTCTELGIEIVYLDTLRDSSSGIIERYRRGCMAAEVEAFERAVHAQRAFEADHYDDSYFVGEWREGGNSYTLEARRRIEGCHPALIKEVFQPRRVLDLGCGPGALMSLLGEVGVHADGVDLSPRSRELAAEPVRGRIRIGSVTEALVPEESYDLVICREVLEHLTVIQIREAVRHMARATSRFVYVTTRFHPNPEGLLDLTDQGDVDPTHITLLTKDFLRLLFVLEGLRSRPDLEARMDWLKKGRVLVLEKARPRSSAFEG